MVINLHLWNSMPLVSIKDILGLQPIPGDPKENDVAAMLDGRTFCFVIQHGRHAIVFLDLQSTPVNSNLKGKLKNVRVIGSSSYQELRINNRKKGKKWCYCVPL